MDLSHDQLLHLYQQMVLARALTEQALAPNGKMINKLGYEAVTVGAALALAEGDIIMPQRHDVGAYLARGLSPEDILAQRMLAGDMRARLIAPPGRDAGKALAVAAGLALGTQLRNEQRVTLVYTDSVVAESADGYEALRFAASHRLPLVCIIAYPFMPPDDEATLLAFTDRIAAFGVAATCIDGGDALAVFAATGAAIDAARSDTGPVALVVRVARLSLFGNDAHHKTDAANIDQDDPIMRLATVLSAWGVLTDERRAGIASEVADSVAAAAANHAQAARAGPAQGDNTLFATAEVFPLGPPVTPTRVAIPVLSKSGGYLS